MVILEICAPTKTPKLDGLLNEVGGHRVQRIPHGEKRGRVHSSTVTVSVLDKDQEDDSSQQFDTKDFQITFFSGTGPGGQNRNKVQASARITHLPTGLVRSAQTRSRKNSVNIAMEALREDLLAMGIEQQHGEQNMTRKKQVGTGMRGDKRRTYRFQDGLAHDHVTGRSHKLRAVMAGDMTGLWK